MCGKWQLWQVWQVWQCGSVARMLATRLDTSGTQSAVKRTWAKLLSAEFVIFKLFNFADTEHRAQVNNKSLSRSYSFSLSHILQFHFFYSSCFQVSWIRKRDLHILTAGSTTYTSDQRFQVSNNCHAPTSLMLILMNCGVLQVLRPDNSANWTLQIKYPQPRDSGVYECQINTEPKMSLSYTFNVVGEYESARMSGNQEC